MVSPEQRNSSSRMSQGPTASRPSRTRAATRSRFSGRISRQSSTAAIRPSTVNRKSGSASAVAGTVSRAVTRRCRNTWNGSYHSRSQWKWGTKTAESGMTRGTFRVVT